MVLTKTDFIQYLRCPESLWLEKHKPEVIQKGEVSLFLQKIIEEGYEVEAYAEKLFPKAIKLPVNSDSKETFKELEKINTQFLQPAFNTKDGAFSRIDILERLSDGTWHLYEVKSSSQVSTKKSHNHIFDACFQKYVLEGNGLEVGKVTIIHLNKEYVKKGDIDPSSLLVKADVTSLVNNAFDTIEQQIKEALVYIGQTEIDESKCSCIRKTRTNHCDNFSYFNPQLPEHPVHEIKRITEKKLYSLLDVGCQDLAKVPDDFELNHAQKAQIDSLRNKDPKIHLEAIRKRLDTLDFPLHFFDYETYATAVPKLDGTGPHQHIPFQVSIHTLYSNGKLEPYDFLAVSLEMPQKLVAGMKSFTGLQGTFISWHATYEKSRNEDMKNWLPEYGAYLEYINTHMFDLEEFFTDSYIDYRFRGSSSIKKVLPVLIPDLTYKNLKVQDGTMAMDLWGRLVFGNDIPEEQIKQTRKELKEYCSLDTLAMVKIYQYLMNLTNP